MSLLEKYRLPVIEIRREDLSSLDRGLTLLEAYTLWTQHLQEQAVSRNVTTSRKPNRKW